MPRIPLLGGAYTSRSIIANCMRCINYYPEINPKNSPVPVTFYQRPGLVPRAQAATASGTVRGLYRSSQGKSFACIGQEIYQIDANWNLISLGALNQVASTPVSFADNGVTMVIADNSSTGYAVNLATNAFSVIVDPTGTFTGATGWDTIDGFLIWNIPGTPIWGSTLDNVLTFNPLYTAAKNNYPDPLQRLICNRHQILLLGALKSEIWYNAGNPNFPFAELPGSYIEHGCIAPYSVATADINTYWLGQDLQGQGIVFRQRGYQTERISNHALELAIGRMAKSSGISDCITYIYQQDGHVFVVFNFPAGDQTWVWDESIGDPHNGWHQRAWTDANGNLHRDRTNCCANINGGIAVGDWQNGTIYTLDLDTYTDTLTVGGTPGPLSCIRTFPHITAGADRTSGQLVENDGKRLQINKFIADMEVGEAPLDAAGNPATVNLRWSLDRGKTYGNDVLQSAGAPGEYLTSPLWQPLGIGRDIVIELAHSIAGSAALNGAWVDVQVARS